MVRNSINPSHSLAEYLKGKKAFPEDIGRLELEGEKTDSEITYYSWNLRFNEDTDAKREDNSGVDEVQVIFNLNKDILWNIESDKTGTFSNKQVRMKKGEVCIIRNNEACTSMSYEGNFAFKFKSLQMPTDRFESLLNNCFEDEDTRTKIKGFVYKDVLCTVITPDMYRIISEIESADKYKQIKGFLLEGKLVELTALVLFQIAFSDSEYNNSSVNIDSNDLTLLEKLRESVQLRPYDNYSAEAVAKSLNMSVSKLNRLFRTVYATSFHAYVQSKRLEYAADLLRNSKCSVTEAATKAGYNNMSYFSKAFFSYFNMMPKEYKKGS